jgi:hypothetical protein
MTQCKAQVQIKDGPARSCRRNAVTNGFCLQHAGERPGQCTAMISDGSRRCLKDAVKGSNVCQKHGAAEGTPARKAADRRVQEAEAFKVAARYVTPIPIDPKQALFEELARAHGWVLWLEEQVAQEGADKLVGSTVDEDGHRSEGVSIWYRMLTAERKRLVVVARDAITAGVEERRIRLAEEAGALLLPMLRGVIEEIRATLNLNATQSQAVNQAIARHLRALPGGRTA